MVLAQPLQGRRQDVGERGRTGSKMNAPDVTFTVTAHRRQGAVGLGHHSLRVGNQVLARRGGACLPADAVDQAQPDPLLQVADLQADRGLREPQMARRGREAAELDHGGQRAKLVKVEAAHLKVSLMAPI